MDTDQYWKDRCRQGGYLNEFKSHNIFAKFLFWWQERAIRKALPKDAETVLEIGCGFGRITKILTENPGIKKIVAIDISEDQINEARANVRDRRVQFRAMSALDLDYEKEFDLVIASEVLLHFSPDRIELLADKMLRASKRYCMNIDWYAPGEPLAVGGYCWQHDYPKLFGSKLVKKLWRQGIFLCSH